MTHTRLVENFEGDQSGRLVVGMDLLWSGNEMVQSLQGNLQNIILRVLGCAKKKHPASLDLITQFE